MSKLGRARAHVELSDEQQDSDAIRSHQEQRRRNQESSAEVQTQSGVIRSHQEQRRRNQESSAEVHLVRPHVELRDDARSRDTHLGARLEQREVRRAHEQRRAAKLGKGQREVRRAHEQRSARARPRAAESCQIREGCPIRTRPSRRQRGSPSTQRPGAIRRNQVALTARPFGQSGANS